MNIDRKMKIRKVAKRGFLIVSGAAWVVILIAWLFAAFNWPEDSPQGALVAIGLLSFTKTILCVWGIAIAVACVAFVLTRLPASDR